MYMCVCTLTADSQPQTEHTMESHTSLTSSGRVCGRLHRGRRPSIRTFSLRHCREMMRERGGGVGERRGRRGRRGVEEGEGELEREEKEEGGRGEGGSWSM